MAQVTGRINIHANGVILRTKEGAKANMSKVERSAVESDQGVAGYVEKSNIPSVECVVIHTSETELESLDFVDGSVQFETDSGKTWILRDAFYAGTTELTGGGGEVPARFEGSTFVPVS